MNKKGIGGVEGIFILFVIGMVAGAFVLTPSFRERKAIEKCQTEGKTESECKNIVSGLSKAQVLTYIRDSEPPATLADL